MHIDEPISVELSPGGAPARFAWRGAVYGVVSAPEPWIGRRAWWEGEAPRAPRGAGPALLETHCWRVDAIPLSGSATIQADASYDLERCPRAGGWRLIGVLEDDDALLIA